MCVFISPLHRPESGSLPHHCALIRQHVLQHTENGHADHQVQQPHQEGADHRQALLLHRHHRLPLLDPHLHPQDLIAHAG